MTPERTQELRDRYLRNVPKKYRKLALRVLAEESSPREAIKNMCLACMGWIRQEVALCTSPACPLYAFRPFKDPSTLLPTAPPGQMPEAGGAQLPSPDPEAP
jgi:hypothetical protein